jgi:predicted transcriptional regulator
MPILKSPPKAAKNETLQLRVEEEIKMNLHRYAEFLNSSESYVVSEALRLLFRKDREFRDWLDRQALDPDVEAIQLKAVAKSA